MIAPLYGLVLSGGRSRRFGTDKAVLEIDGQTLLARTVAVIGPFAERVYVSVRPDQTREAVRSAFALLVDDEPGLGPAAGLRAAHRRHPEVAWLVVACDMPALDETTIRNLVQSRNARRDATAYRSPADGLVEPLCAIYEPATLARFARQAGAGRGLSPRELLVASDVEFAELAHPSALANCNSPADLRRPDRGC